MGRVWLRLFSGRRAADARGESSESRAGADSAHRAQCCGGLCRSEWWGGQPGFSCDRTNGRRLAQTPSAQRVAVMAGQLGGVACSEI